MIELLENRRLLSAGVVVLDHLEPAAPIEPPAVVDEPYWPEEDPSLTAPEATEDDPTDDSDIGDAELAEETEFVDEFLVENIIEKMAGEGALTW